jgi:hypothetical protein
MLSRGLAREKKPPDILSFVRSRQYQPAYLRYV